MIITYVYPIISARAISLVPEFLKNADCNYLIILVGKLDEVQQV